MPEVSCRNEAEKVVARLLAAGVVQEQNGKIVYDFSEKKLVAMRKPEDWLRAVKEKIAQEKTPKPRRRETLVNSVKVFCKNALSEQELVTLVDALFREGYVRENGSKLVYVFEPVPAVPVPIPAPAEKTMEKSAAGCNFVPIQCEEKPQQSWMSLMFGKGK